MIQKPKAQEARKNTWILSDTWRLVDTRFSMCQDPTRNQGLLWCLSRQIISSLKADWKQQVETAGGNIEYLLTSEPPLYKKAWDQMKGWYKVAAGRMFLPDGLTI